MKKYFVLGLLVISSVGNAEVFLSRDFCSIEFDSLKKKSGQRTEEMFLHEINELISKLKNETELSCLEGARISEIDYSDKRSRPRLEKCSLLPSSLWVDKNGNTIYRMTDRQMKRSDDILDDVRLGDCLDPLLDY